MLSYPDFSKKFVIHSDASDTQIGGVVSQEKKPLEFFRKKFNSSQKNYSMGEKELLSIVETIKQFRTMLYGHEIEVYTDHKNLCFDSRSDNQ